jgi:predicted nucleic acid-binding protein
VNGYLLDTSVLSLLAPGRPAPTAAFASWLRVRTDRLHISTVTVAEIEQGICKLRRAGGMERADRLADWLDALTALHGQRILPLDARVARLAGALSDQAIATGRHPGFADVAIAATARAHDLMLLTCNGRHFEPLGIAYHDPLDGLPDS